MSHQHEEFRGSHCSPEQKNISSSETHQRAVKQLLSDKGQLI